MSLNMLRARVVVRYGALAALSALAALPANAQPSSRNRTSSSSAFVPGAGTCIDWAGDNFEDQSWEFVHRHPKSSREQDENSRNPMGVSTNDRWHEGPERGQPDQIELIATPPGGLAGSQQALLLRTLRSGIPGRTTNTVQQDDLIANCLERLRGDISVRERPSCTVRVFLPPADQWEQRSGPHFGYRASLSTVTTTKKTGLFSLGTTTEVEPYWPGMWIHYRARGSKNTEAGTAYIAVRSDRMGRDFAAREMEEFGWWTFGMSFSADGMVHYYASPGVDELTAADYISSQFPYSFTARDFRTYFFDVCNHDNGRAWSTPFIIDDPKLYVQDSRRVEQIVSRQQQAAERNAQRRQQQEERRAAQREAAQQRTAARQSSSR
jgi:hypothetical protein